LKVTVLVKEIRADYLPYPFIISNKLFRICKLLLYENKYI